MSLLGYMCKLSIKVGYNIANLSCILLLNVKIYITLLTEKNSVVHTGSMVVQANCQATKQVKIYKANMAWTKRRA